MGDTENMMTIGEYLIGPIPDDDDYICEACHEYEHECTCDCYEEEDYAVAS